MFGLTPEMVEDRFQDAIEPMAVEEREYIEWTGNVVVDGNGKTGEAMWVFEVKFHAELFGDEATLWISQNGFHFTTIEEYFADRE